MLYTVSVAPFAGPSLNGFIWSFIYRFTIYPIAVELSSAISRRNAFGKNKPKL